MSKLVLKAVILFFLIPLICYCQEKTGAYEYPVKPGMPEWKEILSHKERVKACQIPETMLTNMTTEDLIETCLNYPIFNEMWFYNSMLDGFEIAAKNFNGFQELRWLQKINIS